MCGIRIEIPANCTAEIHLPVRNRKLYTQELIRE